MTNEERKVLVERLRGMKSVRYTHVLEATAQIVADGKRIAELEALLKRWQHSGCPNCSGDCGSANPPVHCCIMSETSAALGDKTDD